MNIPSDIELLTNAQRFMRAKRRRMGLPTVPEPRPKARPTGLVTWFVLPVRAV